MVIADVQARAHVVLSCPRLGADGCWAEMCGRVPGDGASTLVREERRAKRAREQQGIAVGHEHGMLAEEQFAVASVTALRWHRPERHTVCCHLFKAALALVVSLWHLRACSPTDPWRPVDESRSDVLVDHASSRSSRGLPIGRTLDA